MVQNFPVKIAFLIWDWRSKIVTVEIIILNSRNLKLQDIIQQLENKQGKLPGLVVNVGDSQSEPWSLDVSSIPGLPKN